MHDMDRIALAERAAFAEVIAPYRSRIRHLFFGHVHRPISGSWQGIPFSTLRGTSHQVWFDLNKDCVHLASHEPPAYGVVLIGQETVVVHTHDFLDASPRFPFSITDGDNRAYQAGSGSGSELRELPVTDRSATSSNKNPAPLLARGFLLMVSRNYEARGINLRTSVAISARTASGVAFCSAMRARLSTITCVTRTESLAGERVPRYHQVNLLRGGLEQRVGLVEIAR